MSVSEYSYNCKCDKYAKQGKLLVSRTKLEWFLPGNTNPEITFPYTRVIDSGLLVSKSAPKMKVVLTPIDNPTNTDPKSNEAHVLEFDDLVQRDNCRTYITKTISSFRQQSKDLKISPEEKQQLEVLASNPELRQLYEALVKKDVITNEEFWSQHKDMLPTMEKQQTGLKNSFILKNFYKDDTVHITATAMKQIFVQYPGVKAKYEQFVPHSVSETEFWTRFAKAFYLNQTRKSHEGRPDDIFGKAEDISDVPMPTNVQVEKFVDLTTDTSREGYGIRSDELTAPSRTGSSLPILKEYNIRSSRVIDNFLHDTSKRPVDPESEALENRKHTIMEELMSSGEQPFIPLNISDKSKYFEGHKSNEPANQGSSMVSSSRSELVSDYDPMRLLDEFQNEVVTIVDQGLTPTLIPAQLALKIAGELTKSVQFTDSTLSFATTGGNITKEFRTELVKQFNTTSEVMRHLWSLIAIPKRQLTKLEPKGDKLVELLRTKLEEIRQLESEQLTQPISQGGLLSVNQTKQLIKPIEDAIENAIASWIMKTKKEPPARATSPSASVQRPSPGNTNSPQPSFGGMSLKPTTPGPNTTSPGGFSTPQQTPKPGISFAIGKKPTPATTPQPGGFSMSLGPKKTTTPPEKRLASNVFGESQPNKKQK